MSDWFTPIKLRTRTHYLQTFAKYERHGKPMAFLRGAKIVDMDAWKHPRVGFRMFFGGRLETFYSTRDFMKIFDIDKSTVYKWQKLGLIPEPFFAKKSKYNTLTKLYVRGQLAVVAKVVNDLRRQGILRFRKSLISQHIQMVKEGNKVALDRWHKRREPKKERPDIRWKSFK